jgi:sarcosine oxidase, subunit gamma
MLDSSMRRLNSLAKLNEHARDVPAAGLEVLPDAAKLIFRGRSVAISSAGAAFGVALPDVACRFANKGSRSAYWLGPDEWMLEASGKESVELLAQLRKHLGDQSYSLVDVSHRSDAFSIRGERSEYVLNHGCPLDLSERAFPVGACTRTLLWKAGIVLSRVNSAEFRIDVWRSFAPYVWSMLDHARRELG